MTEEILLGDVITTRKTHPCGSSEWTVIRTGADIKIRCNGCGRIVMLDRYDIIMFDIPSVLSDRSKQRKTVILCGKRYC